MKCRICHMAVTAMLLLMLFLSVSLCHALVLDVPEVFQEQDQWCWAGCSQATLEYYGTALTQTEIAAYGTNGYNTWNYLYGFDNEPPYYRKGINMILNNWGLSCTYGAYTMSQVEVSNQIDSGRPFVIRWGWYTGGGHFLVGRGIEDSMVYYMDPWPGEGYNTALYSWVVDDGIHQWTHSLQLTTYLLPICQGSPISLNFDTVCVGSYLDTTFIITNIGAGTLSGSVSESGDDFSLVGAASYSLGAGESDTFTVRFDPQSLGSKICTTETGNDLCSDVSCTGTAGFSDVEDLSEDRDLPDHYSLSQNYPNPFNATANVEFSLPKNCHVKLTIYNIVAQKVTVLIDDYLSAGRKSVKWDGKDDQGEEMPSGAYFYKIKAGEFTDSKKMVILK